MFPSLHCRSMPDWCCHSDDDDDDQMTRGALNYTDLRPVTT